MSTGAAARHSGDPSRGERRASWLLTGSQRDPTGEEQAAWEARFRAGPTGMILYHAAGDASVSPKKLSVQCLSAVLAAGMVSYWLSLAIVPRHRDVLEARRARRAVGSLRILRHQLSLLELVRISERLLSYTRCGHDRRLVTDRCRHRQAASACADLMAPPSGSRTYAPYVRAHYVIGAHAVAGALVCRRQKERRVYEDIPFVVDRGATRACAASRDGPSAHPTPSACVRTISQSRFGISASGQQRCAPHRSGALVRLDD